MNDSYSIQIARERDDEIITRLLIDSFSRLYASLGLEMSTERRAYLSDQASRRSFATPLICVVDGEAAGTITLVPPSRECKAWVDGAWEVRLLAVHPAMQGRGIARALLEYAEHRAQVAGATDICLHTRRGIPTQAKFYPAAGYFRDTSGDLDVQPFQEGYRKILGAQEHNRTE